MSYDPKQPAEFDGERFVPMTGTRQQVRVKLPPNASVNLGAFNAVNRALRDLANPLPPVTRWFRFVRWLRARRAALGVWYGWRTHRWATLRWRVGCRVGCWIAGDDIT